MPSPSCWRAFLFDQGELNLGVRASLCDLILSGLWGRLLSLVMPYSQAWLWSLFQGGTDGDHDGTPIQKDGLCCSRVLGGELPAMSPPLHMVSGSRTCCHLSSGILNKHSGGFFRTFNQWVGVIRIWKKKDDYSVLRCHCFAVVRVYLHKARWLESQVIELYEVPIMYVARCWLPCQYMTDDVLANGFMSCYCSLDCIVSLELDLTLWCFIHHGPGRWQAML